VCAPHAKPPRPFSARAAMLQCCLPSASAALLEITLTAAAHRLITSAAAGAWAVQAITLHKKDKVLEVAFDDGVNRRFSAELLRVRGKRAERLSGERRARVRGNRRRSRPVDKTGPISHKQLSRIRTKHAQCTSPSADNAASPRRGGSSSGLSRAAPAVPAVGQPKVCARLLAAVSLLCTYSITGTQSLSSSLLHLCDFLT